MKRYILVLLTFFTFFLFVGCSLFENKDETVIPIDVEEALIIVANNGLYGLVNFEGNIVLSLQNDSMYYCGSYYIADNDESIIIYNELGEEIVFIDDVTISRYFYGQCPDDYRPIDETVLIPFSTIDSELYGFFNLTGDIVVEAQYDHAYPISEGLALVEKDDKVGYINLFGEEIIPLIYDSAYLYFRYGIIQVRKNDTWGLIDSTGNEILGFEYDSIRIILDGYSIVEQDNLYGIVDVNGNIIIEIIYDSLSISYDLSISDDLDHILVLKDDNYGYIDISGDIIIDMEYSDAHYFIDSEFAIVKKGELWGLIDQHGNTVIDFEYDRIYWVHNSNEYLGVIKDDETALYNSSGDMVLGFNFEGVSYFNDDVFSFIKNSLHGMADIQGNVLVQPTYMGIYRLSNGLRLVKKDDLYGYMNNEGIIVINLEYEDADYFNESGIAAVKLNDKWGFIDLEGNVVIDFLYDRVISR